MTQCTAINVNGNRRRRCGRRAATGSDFCGEHRNMFAAAREPYTCRACGTTGLPRDEHGRPVTPLCVDHKREES